MNHDEEETGNQGTSRYVKVQGKEAQTQKGTAKQTKEGAADGKTQQLSNLWRKGDSVERGTHGAGI